MGGKIAIGLAGGYTEFRKKEEFGEDTVLQSATTAAERHLELHQVMRETLGILE